MTERARAWRLVASLVVLLGGLACPAAAQPRIVFTPAAPRPGDLVLVAVDGIRDSLTGEWGDRPLRFFRVREGTRALAGVDLDPGGGTIPWRIRRGARDGVPEIVGEGRLPLRPRAFATQRLTLPPDQVDLGAETLRRVRRERAELLAVLARGAGERLWRGPFRPPLDGGTPTGGFGLRRFINGQPRRPHAGFDWAAPRGTLVRAPNSGRVALVAEHFFAGRLVVLDHGLGLFTLYFHLDEPLVARGQRVRPGQPIGRVGATGRTTGPHLHFAVLLAGARVDPEALLAFPLPE